MAVKLLNISVDNKIPIYLQIVESITDAVRRGNYKKGERIFSINELSNEYFLSRDTVQKAYHILYEKGVIIPVKGKGYYIKDINFHTSFKVLLLFTRMSNYKKQIYNAFVQTLGEDAIVDIKFHHFHTQTLKTLVENNLGDYNYFVIMPHFYDDPDEALKILKTIPPDKLLILDKIIPYADLKCPAVYQDYINDIVDALEEGMDLLFKYHKLFLVFPKIVPYSPEIISGFRKFCLQNDFPFEVLSEITPATPINAGEAYIVIEESDLANVITKSRMKGLKIGKNIGIISYNDSPLKEILLDGITVISTDHTKMGETAARLILENSTEKIKNPFRIIRRKSL